MVLRPHHHVALSLSVAASLQLLAALISATTGPRAMEALSGLSVSIAALGTYIARGTFFGRQTACTALLVAWGTRLSWYLFSRSSAAPASSVRSLCATRTLWAACMALPAMATNTLEAEREPWGATELFGLALALGGLAFEAIADLQKSRWHAAHAGGRRPPRTSSEPPVCATGLWSVSRHPNLLGEIVFHVGVYLVVCRVAPIIVAVTPAAAVYCVAHLGVGPLQTLERTKDSLFAGHPAYELYRSRTPALVPRWGVKYISHSNPPAALV